MVRRDYVVVAALLLLSALLLIYLNKPSTLAPFVVKGSVNDLATFLDANTVVVRAVYPFSDTQGAVNATVYLTVVFTQKGKRVVLQYVDGNTCYTNEGNIYQAVEVNLSECMLPYPTVEIREGSNLIEIGRNAVEIYGDPAHLMPAASYVARMLYPDADEVYHEAMARLKKVKTPGS